MTIHEKAEKIARATSRPIREVLAELGRRGAKVRILAKTRNVGKSWHRDDLRAIESPQGWMQRWEADK